MFAPGYIGRPLEGGGIRTHNGASVWRRSEPPVRDHTLEPHRCGAWDRLTGPPMKPVRFSSRLASHIQRCLPDLIPTSPSALVGHSLRSVAMQLTGHLTERVYRRCAITSSADLQEGVRKLNAVRRLSAAG
jgi:hypothetical protein